MDAKFKEKLIYFLVNSNKKACGSLGERIASIMICGPAENSQKLADLLPNLPEPVGKLVRTCNDEACELNVREFDKLYLQGYKDCLKMLCYLIF